MATTLQHPRHDHPLVPQDLSLEQRFEFCDLCRRIIWTEAYACQEGCESYYHRVCAEAPPRIESHPLHPVHPLALFHDRPSFQCVGCNEFFDSGGSSFCCKTCEFDLDIRCALSTVSDRGGSQGKIPEQVTLPIHPHLLTSFSTRHDFVRDGNCDICQARVKEDGYMCLDGRCDFLIHKRCVQDLYYADGTKAPRVYHDHPLEIFVGEETGSHICAYCRSDESGEFIGCASCQVFYHKDCIQIPEVLQYPPCPDHSMVLFINDPNGPELPCGSCSNYLEGEWCYSFFSRDFFLHVRCALQTLAYCEEGMSPSIKWTWHKHPLLLCHKTESSSEYCDYCEDVSTGPAYACNTMNCEFLLHEQCTRIQSTRIHPYHPDHLLTLRGEADGPPPQCKGCSETIVGFHFSCELCAFHLHVRCSTRVPTLKHYLHEHELLHLDEAPSWECNCCGTSTDSSLFRCVPCNLNLHEKCMELPRVVNSVVHWHPLTLRESYVEDDSGEYYCDHCEKMRDIRLGVYLCGKCSARWVYHIACALPALGKVFAKKSQTPGIKILDEQIMRKTEEVRAVEEKLEKVKREWDELMKQRAELISKEEKNYAAVTEEGESNLI